MQILRLHRSRLLMPGAAEQVHMTPIRRAYRRSAQSTDASPPASPSAKPSPSPQQQPGGRSAPRDKSVISRIRARRRAPTLTSVEATAPALGLRTAERSQLSYARLAGLMYLVVLAFDIAGLVIGAGVTGGAGFADAAQRVAASETLFRISLVLALGGSMSTVLLAIGLYVTVRPIDGNLALTALLFRSAEAAIGGMAIVGAFSGLQIYLQAGRAGAFDAAQLGALASLTSPGEGTAVPALLFCVGSTIFFYLFLRSTYIPKLLSGLGVFASVLYAAYWLLVLVVPSYPAAITVVASIPALVAEVSTGLWLLIRGVKVG